MLIDKGCQWVFKRHIVTQYIHFNLGALCMRRSAVFYHSATKCLEVIDKHTSANTSKQSIKKSPSSRFISNC